MDVDETPQGWFVDPYRIHEHRWISLGRPINLVRDGNVEAKGDPPGRPQSLPYVPVSTGSAHRDMRRADDASRQAIPDSASYGDVAYGSAVYGSAVGGPAPSGMTGWQTSSTTRCGKEPRSSDVKSDGGAGLEKSTDGSHPGAGRCWVRLEPTKSSRTVPYLVLLRGPNSCQCDKFPRTRIVAAGRGAAPLPANAVTDNVSPTLRPAR